ncbi:MAG: Txe/YoeB family addiction module toxin [Cytophagia bacterium]|nr:MAG: Txe/YoeB family addiction module toxin [Runella sp.]TAG20512.1 MAG: Txe/YoeB family addiction module toxin [Cytophagales bacterium]TAG39694.1 MAG: Txe/YoeB family addiction module toxin [Cytophagia bacterium]TAG74035.1 MAG: Txe/YoeB family addiction module toxin [Runella slithyformis]TAG81296.1 MAG: Txe/YoeB family addiction module toxin [Cytophagales bacterium]
MNSSRNILFEPKAFEEFIEWATEDKKIFFKIAEMIEEIRRTPFEGRGKPEPLKHDLKGYFSRRITDKHRLIYAVPDQTITFIGFKSHYGEK